MKKQIKKQPKPEAAADPNRCARAVVRYLRISPRKMRLVIDTVRFKQAGKAFNILMMQKRKAARMTEKLLKSAVANAKVLGMEVDRLYIFDIRADGGPTFKRFRPRSMGRADRILKRTTHLSLILKEGQKRWTDTPGLKEAAAEIDKPKAKASKSKKKAAAAAK